MENEQQTFEQGVSKRLSLQVGDLSLKNAELAEVINQLDTMNKSLEKEKSDLLSKIEELEKELKIKNTDISDVVNNNVEKIGE